MSLRGRKETLIITLKAHKLVQRLTDEQVATFEMMYRRARTQEEQDEVTKAVHTTMDGWKTQNDRYSRLRRAMNDLDDFATPEDDD